MAKKNIKALPKTGLEATIDMIADRETNAGMQVGGKMPDGTIFAGISPETNRPMYAAPSDLPMRLMFDQAEKYGEAARERNFRIPTKAELNVLFQNRKKGALKGTFNLASSGPAVGHYWSSTPGIDGGAWYQRFDDGAQCYGHRGNDMLVRFVR